jgi:hypothetical protein
LLSLRPVVRNIVEILGIRADLLKQRPAGLAVREVLFGLIFFLSRFQQAVFAPDALYGHVREGQVEFARQPRRSESGQPAAQRYDLLFDLWSGFERMAGSATVFLQTGKTMLLITSPPLTNGQRAGGKEPRARTDSTNRRRWL